MVQVLGLGMESDARVSRRNSHEGRINSSQSAIRQLLRSPSKSEARRAGQSAELLAELRREERLRDVAAAQLSSNQNNRRLRAHLDAADARILQLREQLLDLGVDEDDMSSGDEDVVFDESTLSEEDAARLAYQLGGSSSAASSAIDLALHRSVSGPLTVVSVSNQMTSEVALKHLVRIFENLQPGSRDAVAAVDRVQELVFLIPRMKYEFEPIRQRTKLYPCIQRFLLDKDPQITALGLKLIRSFLLATDFAIAESLFKHLILDYVLVLVLCLESDRTSHDAQVLAVQLCRDLIGFEKGRFISRAVCHALWAAGESNSSMRHICTESLAELAIWNPAKVYGAGALSHMFSAITQPGDDSVNSCAFSLALAMILVSSADRSDIRNSYFRGGKDFSLLLTAFTDIYIYKRLKTGDDFMMQSSIAMQVILRSWVGAFCFDLELFVQCMDLPWPEIQETLLTVIDGVLWLPEIPERYTTSTSANNSERLSYQFTAILLYRLQSLGLQEKLVRLQTAGETEEICHKAQQIGAKIFALSAKLIPRHGIVKQSMALPKELEETLAKAPTYSLPTASIALFGAEAELPSVSTWSHAPSLQTYFRFGVNIDDFSFKRLLHSTHVLDTKVFRYWNWDALMELVQGPLRSPKRLDEVTRGSKFLKRLFAFYRPFKYRFSNLAISKDNLKCVAVGKELMKSLLETSEGARYLAQNKLFRQIAECLAQLDPLSGIVSNEPLLSVRRFKSTLCCAYSELIGVLTRSVVGQQILSQIRIFNMFYRLCDINREDVVRSIVCAIDYRLEGHPRLILAKALTAASKSTRLYTTEFVGYQLAAEEAHLWAIDLMVEQLYDTDQQVGQAAAYGLHNMCVASSQALDYLIRLQPYLNHLSEAAEPLRILFMSRPKGFSLVLNEFEHRDMSHWAPGFNEAYVDKIELFLEFTNTDSIRPPGTEVRVTEQSNFTFPLYSRPSKRGIKNGTMTPPAHFYGELALTMEGCRFLESKGGLNDIRQIVLQAAEKASQDFPPEKLKQIKGALWAIGHVASRENGGTLFEISDVNNICKICWGAATLSLRGTAYYVLGLFGHSMSGAELIHQCGWDVVYDPYDRPVGVVLPNKPGSELSSGLSPSPNTVAVGEVEPIPTQATPDIRSLLMVICKMNSGVVTEVASKYLISMRAAKPELFERGETLQAVFDLLTTGNYKQIVRRFVFGLFNVPLCLKQLERELD